MTVRSGELSADEEGAVFSLVSGVETDVVAASVSLMCEVARVIRRRMGEDGGAVFSRFRKVGMCGDGSQYVEKLLNLVPESSV